MTRREFHRLLAAAAAGLVAGGTLTGCKSENGATSSGDAPTTEKHACKGMNSCKGQGGCKSGDNGCAGKNSCKGKGGCAVPVQHM